MSNDLDPERPMSLSAWRERQKRELEQQRASVHAEVDRMFDQIAERQRLDFHRVERDLLGLTQH